MKYTKRLVLNRFNPTDSSFAVAIDSSIVTTTKVGMQLPSGAEADRAVYPVNGVVRYNQTTNDSEIYNIAGEGTGWEKIKMNRQDDIICQNVGTGDYTTSVFGPLAYNVDITKPQNVMIYVENVYQIPITNYTLTTGPGTTATTYISFTSPPPDKTITALLGFDNFAPTNN